MHHAEFRHPRMPAIYDAECPWSRDDDFFVGVVADESAVRIADLGCGTGRLTIALADRGHAVTGVDPAAASLEHARSKPGAERVTWVLGSSPELPVTAFDALLMTSHVAQFFTVEPQWRSALADIRRSLVPGGRLIFDSRDPADRRWEQWNSTDRRGLIPLAEGGTVEVWTQVTAVSAELDPLVAFEHHYTLPDGEIVISEAELRFRREPTLRNALAEAGFEVEVIYGGWGREPVGHRDGEFLVVARAC